MSNASCKQPVTSPYWLSTHIVHFRFTQYARNPDQIYIWLI